MHMWLFLPRSQFKSCALPCQSFAVIYWRTRLTAAKQSSDLEKEEGRLCYCHCLSLVSYFKLMMMTMMIDELDNREVYDNNEEDYCIQTARPATWEFICFIAL